MVTQLVANDSERPAHCSFAPQAPLVAPDDLLDHLADALHASVAHPDGDPTRWSAKVGQGVVLVKPTGSNQYLDDKGHVVAGDYNMVSNLIIHTDQHNYTLLLKLGKPYTQAVGWFYPEEVQAAEAAHEQAIKDAAAEQPTPAAQSTPTARLPMGARRGSATGRRR